MLWLILKILLIIFSTIFTVGVVTIVLLCYFASKSGNEIADSLNDLELTEEDLNKTKQL